MSRQNNGKEAEQGFEEYWTKRGHVERLYDAKDLMALNGGQRVADFAKPADFLVSAYDTPLHYAEVKSTVDEKVFTFNKIRPKQAKAAQMECLKGANAYVFYIFSYATGLWYKMPCEVYVHQLKMGRKSIPFSELEPWNR